MKIGKYFEEAGESLKLAIANLPYEKEQEYKELKREIEECVENVQNARLELDNAMDSVFMEQSNLIDRKMALVKFELENNL